MFLYVSNQSPTKADTQCAQQPEFNHSPRARTLLRILRVCVHACDIHSQRARTHCGAICVCWECIQVVAVVCFSHTHAHARRVAARKQNCTRAQIVHAVFSERANTSFAVRAYKAPSGSGSWWLPRSKPAIRPITRAQ